MRHKVLLWIALGIASGGLSACNASSQTNVPIPKVVRTEAETLRRVESALDKALCPKPCTRTTPGP